MKLTTTDSENSRYFTAKLGWGEQFNPKQIEMLTSGAVPQLIPPESVQGRKNNIIRYNISAYSTLAFYLSCILSREQFAQMLLQCVDLFRQIQRMSLDYKNLLFDFDRIYVLLSDRTLHFLYLPLSASRREVSLSNFFKKLVESAGRSTSEQSSFLDGCVAWLNRPAAFSLDAFETYVREKGLEERISAGAQNGGAVSSPPQPGPYAGYQPPQYRSPVMGATSVPTEPLMPHSAPSCMEAELPTDGVYLPTVSLYSQQEEMPLSAEIAGGRPQPPASPRCYLIRVQTGERIEINRPVFLVGKESGSVSYQVTGNAAVSRRHAEFTVTDSGCWVKDLNSTNKTYVNGRALAAHVPERLNNGDRIRLGNEEFFFSREG